MGIFDRFLLGKQAGKLGFTVEQYKEYLQYQKVLSVEEYRRYLDEYSDWMQVEVYADRVLRARAAAGAGVPASEVQAGTGTAAPSVHRRRRQAILMEQSEQIQSHVSAQNRPEESVSKEALASPEAVQRIRRRSAEAAELAAQRTILAEQKAAAEARERAAAEARERAAAEARARAAAEARERAAAEARERAAAEARKRAAAEARERAAAEARARTAAEARERAASKPKTEAPSAAAIEQPVCGTAKKGGGLYPIGQEPERIRARLDRLFEKLDGAYPDKVISGLTKNHGPWAETVTDLYRILGYPDSWSFLEAYGYTMKVNEENSKGGRPAKDCAAVIGELKRRYPQPVEGSIAFLMEQNPDLAPRIKTLQNSAQKVFGMRLIQYLVQEGILAEWKTGPKIEKPVIKQPTPEEKLEQITAELKRRYPTLKSAPRSLVEPKEKNADLPIGTLNELTKKIAKKTAGEYCFEHGLICDAEKMKKAALEPAADGRNGWGEKFTRTILERGLNMFIADEVKSLDKTANGYAAKVQGTSMYSVSISVLEDEVHAMSCTCPYAADGLNCKHMAAVLFKANAKLYAPKVKKPEPVRTVKVVSQSCKDNEILIVSKDKSLLRSIAANSVFGAARIHPCSENAAYDLCEIQVDESNAYLSYQLEMICSKLDGRGVALGRLVNEEHEISEIGFYDGECLWIGSEFDLMDRDSDAPNVPEEWESECNSKKRRTWSQSKKVWKKIWDQIPYYKVSDLIAFYEENCTAAQNETGKNQMEFRDTTRRCDPGELMIVSNDYETIEELFYDQGELEPKGSIRQCAKSPDAWYAVFDLNACEEIQDTMDEVMHMIMDTMIMLARWKDEEGNARVWFFDTDNLWADIPEEELNGNHDPQEDIDRYYQEIIGSRDEEQIEAVWRDVRGRMLTMTTGDWARFIEEYGPDDEE